MMDDDQTDIDEITDELHWFTVQACVEMIERAAETVEDSGLPKVLLMECILTAMIDRNFTSDFHQELLTIMTDSVRVRLEEAAKEEQAEAPAAGSC